MNPAGCVAGAACSIVLHVAVGAAITAVPPRPLVPSSEPIEFEVEEPPPAPEPEPEPEPEKPAPAPRRVVQQYRPQAPKPQPMPATPAAPPPAAAPIFGVDMSDTAPGGSIAVPVGTTTLAAPGRRAAKAVAPAPAVPPPPPPVYITELPEVVSTPGIDGYPPECHEAEAAGVAGVVRLAVTVLESGRVGEVRLVRGIDACLDAAAVRLMRQFRFKPAVASDGKPARYHIKDYRFRFTISR